MVLFIYLWLCWVGATLVAALSLSLRQLVLLWSRGSGACGLSSGGAQALEHRLSTTGAWAYLLLGMWDLPRSGIEPVSPASAGRFFTTETPGKPSKTLLNIIIRKQFNLEQQQKDVKRRYPKENIRRHEKFSASFITREIQSKTTGYLYTPIRMVKFFSSDSI